MGLEPRMVAAMAASHRPGVHSALPALLAAREMTWGELRRRTLLPAGTIARLRRADANPPLAVAERVAAALDVSVEEVWSCPSR